MKTILLLFLLLPAAFAATSPYAGEQNRSIKSLSAEEVSGYLAGHGMGLARPAELNGYPGPRHALDAGDELGLTPEQVKALTQAFEKMKAAAIPLGEALVARETELDRLFTDHRVTEPALQALTAEIGRLQGELRAVHLAAHLATVALLTPEQIARYNHLRGYDQAPAATADHAHRNHVSP